MWGLVLYIIACAAGLILFLLYEKDDELKSNNNEKERHSKVKQQEGHRILYLKEKARSIFNVIGIDISDSSPTKTPLEVITARFSSLKEVSTACRSAGLDSSNLIIGIDFTASNEWQGKKNFKRNCLHEINGNKINNPYQKVIWILGNTLKPFDDDNLIPAYGFGDIETTDKSVFPFKSNGDPCVGFEEVLQCYNDIARGVTLSGPTNFAPVIDKAIEIVKSTQSYHILVIIADGQVTEEDPTIDSIVRASDYPLSIIVVGVGDGPWEIMHEFDHRLPRRKFDNFHFVNYHQAVSKSKNPDAAFALQALMEIPDQYKKIKKLGYLGSLDSPVDRKDSTGSSIDYDSPDLDASIRRSRFSAQKKYVDRNGNTSFINDSFYFGSSWTNSLSTDSDSHSSRSSLKSTYSTTV